VVRRQKLFRALFGHIKGKSLKASKEGDWAPLIHAIEQRIDELDGDDEFTISLGNGDYRQIAKHPTVVIWQNPTAESPNQCGTFQITCFGLAADGIGSESVFLAWSVAGFQAVERKGQLLYAKGDLWRHQTKGALLAAFGVMEATCGINKNVELLIFGDEEFQAILSKTEGIRGVSRFRFSLAG